MIKSLLLKFARQVVASVMSQLTQQQNIVENMAVKPMQMMIQQVVGGVWIGKGADAFVQDVSTIFIPKSNQIIQNINKFTLDIKGSVEIIDQADKQVNTLVNGLSDVFGSVY
jgi:hypothetical protein